MRLTVIGNPENRRVTMFAAAVRSAGLPAPAVVPWREVAAGGRLRFDPETVVRLDSPGEDAEVDRLLRGAAEPAAPGEIVGLGAWYRGFAAALTRIASATQPSGAAGPGATAAAGAGAGALLTDPAEALVMFDKPACHARLAGAGVAVPAALDSPADWDDLRARMGRAGWTRVFVKPAHGSSASGVLAVRTAGSRVVATTSVELDRGRLFNSLRVREYRDERDVAAIVNRLAADRLHVERWFPKAGLAGRVVDLRVVVIAGVPTHVVVRSSRYPMTNLHLGNARGDLTALRAVAGPENYAAALATCVRAAGCFPASLHVGVDLMFAPGWRRHAVAEVNAFGDLLPGLTTAGRDTYAEEVHALLTGRFAAWRQAAGGTAPRDRLEKALCVP